VDQPVDTFRSSTIGWLRGSLAGWGTILLAVAGILLCAPGTWDRWPLLLTLLAAGLVAARWIGNMAARYDLTEDRLIVRRGIVMKSLDEVELYRVKDIRLDFSLVNQLAGLGTICIVSSDETTRGAPLVIRDVARAAARREMLRDLVDKARQKRRVREVDMAPEPY
jgi:uncharacterized membrane protein YdbT with pleckstrin-like domain